ncbi:UNVERIFIED_CONTAM: hypothetical protein PYX00_009399 [Menopon gallinae]|uniref:rhomboid protease n=1 Tax=Menopon gallinae TaxID=328185 RepID=A0AAW2HBF7_9NEOP
MERDEAVEEIEIKVRPEKNFNVRSKDEWTEVFNRLDKDRDGKITYKELKDELYRRGTRDLSRRILRKGDLNDDGYINLTEFLHLVRESKDARDIFSMSVNKWVKTVCYIPRRAVTYADTIDARGEYEEEYSCWPPPLCMLAVSLLEITVYVYDAIVREPNQPYIYTALASLFIYNPRRRAEAWRFLTYMFVHIGIFHLIVNLFVQIVLGIPLEMVHSWWRVLIVYISGVVAGSLGTSISDPRVLLAGASGGVYAIIAAHVATLIMNWKEMEFAVIQLVIFLFLAVTDIGMAVYNRYILEIEDQISYVAHLAGATAGLLIGINVLRNLQVRRWERLLWWISISVYTILMGTAIVWHIAYPGYFPKQEV